MIARVRQQGPRYIAVSLFCVLFNTILLISLDWAGLHYGASVLISAAVLIPLSYALHCTFTFAAEPGWRAFWRYAAAQIVNTPLAWLLFLLIHDWGALPMVFAAPLVIGLLFLWNFFTSGWAIAWRTVAKSSL
jgi:putative flippase GtrA